MSAPALTLDEVTAGYGRTPVLTGITLRIEAGELVGVLGPSGSGKTTLLRLLTGHADRLSGRVEILGRELGRGRIPRVGYVPQLGEADSQFPVTVLQTVLLGDAAGSARKPWFSRPEHTKAHGLLERLGLTELARRPLDELSGGQRQRTFIARALMHDAKLLLLDEPTSGVDLQVRADVLGLVGELNREQGITALVTTHDLNWVAAHLPRVVCVNQTIIGDGTPAEVFTPEILEATYGTRMHIVRDGHRLLVADQQPLLTGERWA